VSYDRNGDAQLCVSPPLRDAIADLALDLQVVETYDLIGWCGGQMAPTIGTPQDDYIYGTPGDDHLYGESETHDLLDGGPDDDWLGAANDRSEEDPCPDYQTTMYGGTGNDDLNGGCGREVMYGGDDHVYGEGGNDALYGDDGIDALYVGLDDDHLQGDTYDLLDGGPHQDWCFSSSSNVTFVDCEHIY
jgi:Ca2+-binding RTX toxin-like protein